MGSTGIFGTEGRTVQQILRQQLTSRVEPSGRSWRPLKIATKGFRTSYVAYEITQPGREPFVIGMVVSHQRYKDEFVYKEVTEDMGPCEAQCPESVLKLLSPLEAFCEPGTKCYEWAQEWRARCWAQIAKGKRKVPTGSRIRFAQPIRFVDGQQHAELTVGRLNGRTFFEAANGSRYRIRDWKKYEFELLGPPTPEAYVAQLLAISGTRIEVHPANGQTFTLDELQELVGGYVQALGLPDGRTMLIDEDGKAKGLARNPEASRLMASRLLGGDYIVGPALLVRQNSDGDYV